MLRNEEEQPDLHILDNAVVTGELDCLNHSKWSMPSMDRPRHGTCALIAAGNWTYDAGLLGKIKTEHKLLAFQLWPN